MLLFLQATNNMMFIVFLISANSFASWSTLIVFISTLPFSHFVLTKKSASFYSLITPCPIKASTFKCCAFSFAVSEAAFFRSSKC